MTDVNSDAIISRNDELSLHALTMAYMALLMMPHGAIRIRSQGCMAHVRDAIAYETGDDPQNVQDFYENAASRGTQISGEGYKIEPAEGG